ncbi:MAG: adenylosuccinate synthetase, partial [Chloroflexi bacterium]|nr:adenylosuccinate synthetase [Chloroflexota bacterium]
GALLGLGLGPHHVRRVIGVAKAFQTRVGAGPFPTEVHGQMAERLRGTGANPWDEFGTTTGRPRRVGWLDGVLLRYAARVNGLTDLAITKLDILRGIPTLLLCGAYRRHDHRTTDLTGTPAALEAFTPDYESLDGWDVDVSRLQSWEVLPAAARTYLEHVEQIAGVPIRWISVGPEREQLIVHEGAA